MENVVKAIEAGRCALAVSGSLLRDPEVMLALSNRASLSPMALAGPAVSPIVPVSEAGVARALGLGGVVVLVEPEAADSQGLDSLGRMLQRAKHKPTVVVVARNFSPFAFTALRGLKVEHEKGRGKAFLTSLPEPPAAAEEGAQPDAESLPKKAKPHAEVAAPRFQFVGREDELAALREMLQEGGPIVVSGPPGVGRTWLVEHAVAATESTSAGAAAGEPTAARELRRLPDVILGFGSGADTLAARLAEVARQGGSSALADLLQGPHTPADVARVAVEALQAASGCENQVMVVHGVSAVLGRELDMFRKSRLEMLLQALFTHRYPLRLVFVAAGQPRFYREGRGQAIRALRLQGIKGRFLHEIFDAYKAPEFPREKFGPIFERVHGHALAARQLAIEIRLREDGLELLDDPKFMKMESVEDLAPLRKRLARRLEKLPQDLRASLAALAHLRHHADGTTITALGINRKHRLELLAAGLLEQVGTEEDRRYRVHALVRSQLNWREISDFDVNGTLSEHYAALARKTDDAVVKLAMMQEANRCAYGARNNNLRQPMEFPDQDPRLESIVGLMRGKPPRYDLAQARLKEAIQADRHNADAWILQLELLQRTDAEAEAFDMLYEDAHEVAAVPELFHQLVNYWVGRRQRPKAISALEKAVQLLPDESRLHTRLASLLFQQGRRPEAIEHLNQAMALDPMLPDAYGLMGQARRVEGDLEQAEVLLREAVRLAPGDVVQITRLADLLLARARADLAQQKALRAQVHEMLTEALKSEEKSPEAYVLLATVIREEAGDLERADYLLKAARQESPKGSERRRRIAVELALVDLARGRLDEAEAAARDLCQRDPSNHRAFAALGHVLEAREQYIVAHAEYRRALERAPQGSLEAATYEDHVKRMQVVIEAQAAGLLEIASEDESLPMPSSLPVGHQRVIRRRARKDADDDPSGLDPEPTGEVPLEPEEAPAEELPPSQADE